MLKSHPARTLVLAGALLIGSAPACSQQEPTGDLSPSVAVIYGYVTNGAQAPIARADVKIEAYRTSCSGDELIARDWALTDSLGYYRRLVGGPHVSRFDACIVVQASPPPASGYLEASEAGAIVRFIYQADTPPVDSVQVDVTLHRNP